MSSCKAHQIPIKVSCGRWVMTVEAGSIYEFGPFRLDPAERELRRDGAPVVLTPKALDTLHILVQSGAVIGSKAGVLPGKIVRPGVWWGIPIQPLDEYKRLNAHISRLPHVREQIKDLSERIKILERQLLNGDE